MTDDQRREWLIATVGWVTFGMAVAMPLEMNGVGLLGIMIGRLSVGFLGRIQKRGGDDEK